MLANDFTQINDLGYGLVVNNAAFLEQAHIYILLSTQQCMQTMDREIRALNCPNGYGNFGLVAEGADPKRDSQIELYYATIWCNLPR